MKQSTPIANNAHFDVVIIGGAMMGSSVAWFLSDNSDFDGSILVVERDPTYQQSSTAHTNSCMRQQFSDDLNVRISQYAAEYIKDFQRNMGADPEVPEIQTHLFGYMYLANTTAGANRLMQDQRMQAALGAGTEILTPEAIGERFPFYNLDDIIVGCHNMRDEGYFDGNTLFDWWRRSAKRHGATFISNEVVAIDRIAGQNITGVRLATGEQISCGMIVNATGPRAAATSEMAGIRLPVEPRKRYTFVFDAAQPLDRDLPLTVDPSGVHVRTDGAYYMAGCSPDVDHAVAADDFEQDFTIWEQKAWPAIATRIPQFETVKLINSWAGHYAYNTLDQNAIVGPHPEVENFLFINGFSGHGFQQSPAMGRAISEWICYGEYRTLDMTQFGYERVESGRSIFERAVI